MVMGYSVNGLAPGFWSRPMVERALARCDFAVLMEQIRREHGWTQAELARAVGYSQSWVSKVLRERQVLTVDQAREVARRLEMPVHLLGLAGREVRIRRNGVSSVRPWCLRRCLGLR